MSHLHPRYSIFSLGEIQNLLSKATFEPDAIVMGDFNTISENDVLPDLTKLSLNARSRLLNTDGTVGANGVSLFKSHGFVDLGERDGTPTYPTKIFEKDRRDGIRLRLDYMFASSRLAKLSHLKTVTTPAAQLASDHLPLFCEIRI